MTDRIAVLLMAYGTPRNPAEIEPYYTDIRRGRPPTPEQLADLISRYEAIGGISPLAQRTEAQRDALQRALDERSPDQFEVVLGLKHAEPKIETAVADLAERGFRKIVGLVLAPHYSSFSIGQYLDRAKAAALPFDIEVAGVESWATEPAFVEFLSASVRQQLAALPAGSKVLFTAHSLPQRIIAAGDPYPAELRSTAVAVAADCAIDEGDGWGIAWQSAGRTPEPWLGPDVLEVITALADEGVPGVVVSACGFVADHLEVLFDLDIEASAHAAKLGIAFGRTACVNDDAVVIGALADRVLALA
jgi:protoporphyrin/coproporphyrin ferrochelatase